MNKISVLMVGTLAVAFLTIFGAVNASASGMSIAPLEYQTSLKAGQYRKGYVDILNPDAVKTNVQLHVEAFKQINSSGGLEFYNEPGLNQGIRLDLTSIELGPNEGARIYFQLDADKLPSGDVFAAILADATPSNKSVQTIPSAQAGTLLLLENGAPPAHHATVNGLQANFWQFGNGIQTRFQVKNTDPAGGSALGFEPKIAFSVAPYSHTTLPGPLVFAGYTREVAYTQPGSYFGPLRITASIDGHGSSRWVFAVTGFYRWLVPAIVVVLVAGIAGVRWLLRRRRDL